MKHMMSIVMMFTAIFSHLVSAAPSKGYTETQYPIVLVHGFLGFDDIQGYDYFYQIAQTLRKDGAKVFTAQVSSANTTEVRGEQLLKLVKQYLARTGAKKVNLVGHSHGGPTSRYVASVAPEIVASVTSIGGVNKGSKFADLFYTVAPDGTLVNSAGANIIGYLSKITQYLSSGSTLPVDATGALKALTTHESLAFNKKYPEGVPTTECGQGAPVVTTMVNNIDHDVYYYSWSGNRLLTSPKDALVDGPLKAVSLLAFGSSILGGEENDGMVGVCSTHLGKVINDSYRMNHVDEINQVLGHTALFLSVPSIYRQHANRLKLQGL
ncbi:esterase/lipase family protein [Vibrio splendidus]|uniref:esterase/lipase family protein n=1 Tax=Vibrio splendidus TaxID=29497 RepID=UPI00021BDB09|nr:triacylglycerol lipase [Vibrio splendidus]EGU45735.1 putative lactonizing lipase [Vibrio splendidus ATCC 33789]